MMQKEKFGTTKDGREVTRYTLTNQNGMKVSFIDLGAVITNIWVPDRDGNFDDVVHGMMMSLPTKSTNQASALRSDAAQTVFRMVILRSTESSISLIRMIPRTVFTVVSYGLII